MSLKTTDVKNIAFDKNDLLNNAVEIYTRAKLNDTANVQDNTSKVASKALEEVRSHSTTNVITAENFSAFVQNNGNLEEALKRFKEAKKIN